ncbi:MAG: hypothetical protein IJY03_07460 [Prevotella sp.]|nr:hypothetical protein [Prevotella sp.]
MKAAEIPKLYRTPKDFLPNVRKEASDEKVNKKKSTFQDFSYKDVSRTSIFQLLSMCFNIRFIGTNLNSCSKVSWKQM